MTFEEYWATQRESKVNQLNPSSQAQHFKEVAEAAWVEAMNEGYKWGVKDTEVGQYDRGHLNP